jgi:hypothetical protein
MEGSPGQTLSRSAFSGTASLTAGLKAAVRALRFVAPSFEPSIYFEQSRTNEQTTADPANPIEVFV